MLSALSIRDIVLIERLDLDLGDGLCVLTGETGAGKSILLDSLGLALGRRAEQGLVRAGAEQGSVSAVFDLPPTHPTRVLLGEQGLEGDGALVLRRVIGRDGKSRAFVNDQPVGVALLRRLGALLVEVHGQSDEQMLNDLSVHRDLLDAYGGHDKLRLDVATAHGARNEARSRLAAAEAAMAQAQRDEEYLRHVTDELSKLAPEAGEEERLAAERLRLQSAEKITAALAEAETALSQGGAGGDSVGSRLRLALRAIERANEKAGGGLEEAIAALERAFDAFSDAESAVERAGSVLDLDAGRLELVEERLFALRAAARKHQVTVDDLPRIAADFAARLTAIDGAGTEMSKLTKAAKAADEAYRSAASRLTEARRKAAALLDKAVAGELKPLKLGTARFATELRPLADGDGSEAGAERVEFMIATNPGLPPGPLSKIASGGELSRFMLALRVVLASRADAVTLVFDEVDQGIGGATAAAVGERLGQLGLDVQVLVVTHSPQVAARGSHHWRIAKSDSSKGKGRDKIAVTSVTPLQGEARREEIARMLAGSEITAEARAAADRLLAGSFKGAA